MTKFMIAALLLIATQVQATELCEVTLYHLPVAQRDGSVEFTTKAVKVACEDKEVIQELDEWNGEGWSNLDSLNEWQERNCN